MLTDFYSDALIELLFEKSDDFIGIYDLTQEQYVRVNSAGVRMLGFASEEAFLTDPIRARTLRNQPLESTDQNDLITHVIREGQYEETTQICRQDGQVFWGQIITTPFQYQGHPYALIRVMDQERLHQAEQKLEHSVRRNEAIFSNATIGIIVGDRKGHIVSANQLAHQLFGYEAGELMQLSIEHLVPVGVGRYHEKLRNTFNSNPQVRAMGHNRDLHAQRKDGSVFPVEISLSYFRLEDELYVVAYIIDISFKKETEQQLRAHHEHIERLNTELEQKVVDRTQALLNTLEQLQHSKNELDKALATERELGELKSRFVSMASHEFRTPLTTVLTSATLIEKYTDSDQQDKREKHLGRIRSSVNHLNDILEEFLSVGKMEEGKVEAHAVQCNLTNLVQETIADLQTQLKPGQTVQTHLACQDSVWLDASLLRKILVNLISNALKYSGPGSVVTVAGRTESGQFKLIVQDQGVGISKEDQIHLFERFFRAHNVTDVAGTGLGLHIVGRYVELMGGQVSLKSELNQGTTVSLTLPYEDHSVD